MKESPNEAFERIFKEMGIEFIDCKEVKMKKETIYVAPDVLIRLMLGKEEELLKKKGVKLVTSAFAFWEALSSLTADEIEYKAEQIAKVLKTIPIIDLKEFTGKEETQNEKRIKQLRKSI